MLSWPSLHGSEKHQQSARLQIGEWTLGYTSDGMERGNGEALDYIHRRMLKVQGLLQ